MKRRRRGLRLAFRASSGLGRRVLAAGVVTLLLSSALLLAGPARPAAAIAALRPGATGAFHGLGAWLDVLDWSSTYTGGRQAFHAPDDVDAMAAHGVQTLYIQTSRFDRPETVLDPELLGGIISRAHARNMRVVGWYLPTFVDPATDLARLQAVAALPLDAVGVDIESTAQTDIRTRNARLVQLSADLRGATGKPIAAIVLPPVVTDVLNTSYWPDFPWTTIRTDYDVWMPMGYWTNRSPSSGWRDGYRYTAENIDRIRAHLGDPAAPVHPVGGIASDVTPAEVTAMVRAAADRGAVGGSLYDYETTGSALWGPLHGFSDLGSFVPWSGREAVRSATSPDGRIEVFAQGPDGALLHTWQLTPNGTWSPWTWMGVFVTAEPTVARSADGRLELWATDTQGALVHTWQVAPNGTWSPWRWAGALTTGSPTAATAPDGRLELFATQPGGGLIHTWQLEPSGSWSPWTWTGAIVDGPTSVAAHADGHLELFATDRTGGLIHDWQVVPNGPWHGAEGMGLRASAAPTVATAPDGRLELFTTDLNGGLIHTWQLAPNGPWPSWQWAGTSAQGPPAVGTAPDGRLELFATDPAGALVHSWQLTPNGTWSDWTWAGTFARGRASVDRSADGRLELFATAPAGALMHSWQLTPNGTWSAWTWAGAFVI